MRREFDTIMDERHVVPSLNELDGLIEEARRRKGKAKEGQAPHQQCVQCVFMLRCILKLITRPHTLLAQQLYLAHLTPALSEYSQELHQRQEALQSDNVEMLERVMKQRREIGSLVQGLENVITDLDSSVGSLQSQEAAPAA